LTIYLRAGRNWAVSAPARLTSKAERTRAGILEAAETLFAARGFEATRLEDVAERVGIRRASIVYYFRDKRELYDAVLVDVFSGLLAPVRAALEGAGALPARVEAAVSAWVEYVARRPSLPRLLLREVLDAGGEAPVLRAQIEPFIALVERVLARSGGDPLLDDPLLDPAHFASAVAGTSVFYLTALPTLVPELGGELSAERLRDHREQLLRVTRRLIRAPRRASKS
jgi:TetR/AcrR family transcriptional regulator